MEDEALSIVRSSPLSPGLKFLLSAFITKSNIIKFKGSEHDINHTLYINAYLRRRMFEDWRRLEGAGNGAFDMLEAMDKLYKIHDAMDESLIYYFCES